MTGSHAEPQRGASRTLASRQVATAASLPSPLRARPWARRGLSLAAVVLCLILAWEGVKFMAGDPWTFSTDEGALVNIHFKPPLSFAFASDLNMPHVWDIGAAFLRPARRNGPLLITILLDAAMFTMREAVVGFASGALLGFLLGTAFAHSALLERSLVPYVVASQTVPILAIAPMVVVWLRAGWWSVAIIAAYLAFFPMTINTLRGLRSADPRALELMQSYAASRWTTLWKLRLPTAAPYIFTALKVSATTSVVGAIIGELPSGIRDGLGGAILNFNQYYISGPAKLWATIIIAALVGVLFFMTIGLSEHVLLRYKPVMRAED